VGCGGSDDEPATSAAATATATATAAADTTAEPTATEEPAASGAADLTPLGTRLKVGDPAVIAYKDASNHKKSTIKVTPLEIEKGSLDDFENIDLDKEQKSSTPYYAHIVVANVGEKDLSGAEPAGYLNGVDDRGQDQNEVIFFGTFEACGHETPKSLKPGEKYETCLVYLMPEGGAIVGFHWIQFDEKTGKADLSWE